MKFKQLTWFQPNDYTIMNEDTTPNLLYRIAPWWDAGRGMRSYRVEYIFGYVPEALGRGYTGIVDEKTFDTVDEAKVAAQAHYERLITQSYFEKA